MYARRFKFDANAPAGQKLRDPNGTTEGRAGIFVVDHDPCMIVDLDYSNATVALTLADDQNAGKFVVAWNVLLRDVPYYHFEVRGQYYDANGTLHGGEFRVNQDNSPTDGESRIRLLAESAQNTLTYSAAEAVVATWSVGQYPDGVHFTMLPSGYSDTLLCCKGDFNSDEHVNGADIQGFVNLLLGIYLPCPTLIDNYCRGDINNDDVLNNYDVDLFVDLLYAGAGCAEAAPAIYDCNNNQVDDAIDIANHTSQDCNANGYPDECDVVLWQPWGSLDCNENGVPDECDLMSETSADCNYNGVPDECDIAVGTSIDRTPRGGDGIPDECDIEDFMMQPPDEGESASSGEGGMECAEIPEDLDAAWQAFYEWSFDQCWGPNCEATGAEQFQAYVAKLTDLGLPIMGAQGSP